MGRKHRWTASALVVVVGAGTPLVQALHRPAAASVASGCDAVCVRARTELANFTGWLARNDAQGFIGEVGWPDDRRGDADEWSAVADRWFSDADAAGVWVTAWATGEWWGSNYPLTPYEDRVPGGGVDSADVQAGVLESHPSTGAVIRGVNVAGAEFGAPSVDPTSPFSNHDPGPPEVAYHYDSQATFDYLAGRGVRLVRLPVRWERLQRAPFAPLDPEEVSRLRAALGRAGASGLRVVVDVHNFGGYFLFDGTRGVRRAIGSPELPPAAFADLWSRMSAALAHAPSVLGYGLMNEPVGLPTADGLSPAKVWEQASQSAVDAIRATGDQRVVLVAGNEWSGAQRWSEQHPEAWIKDPAGRIRYEAHHYWDTDNSGAYAASYRDERAAAEARGYADEAPPPPSTPDSLPPAAPLPAPVFSVPPPVQTPVRPVAACRRSKRRRCPSSPSNARRSAVKRAKVMRRRPRASGARRHRR